MTETTTTIDPNLLAILQNAGQLSPLYATGDTSQIDKTMQTTTEPNIGGISATPTTTVASDHGRNANEISKLSATGSDEVAAAAAVASAAADIDADGDSTSDAPYVIPLKIILPVEHVHKSKTNNSYVRYNYILLKMDDITYHEHIPTDNMEILFPLVDNVQTESPMEWPTTGPDSDNSRETTIASATIGTVTADKATATSTANVFDTDGNEQTNANAAQNDIVLVDSHGFRYELTQHITIMDEFETNVVEFDNIAMVREKDDSKPNPKPATKRILSDDDERQQIDHEVNDINVSQYERHYAKIFQWLHYHL